MDPQLTRDGKPFGPIRYEELVKERYLISKMINTSYRDTGKLTPLERKYIVKYIVDEWNKKAEQEKEQLEKLKNKR